MKKIFLIITMSLFLFSCGGDSKEVKNIKEGRLNGHSEITLGEAIDGFMGSPKWESIEAEDGNIYVNVKGNILYQDKEIEALIQYKVNEDSFKFSALEFNGIPQNMFMYSGLISKMYEK